MSLQGKTTEKIHDYYKQHGFDLVNTTKPADHIQFELEFLSCIYRQGRFESGDYFLSRFFVPWFDKFRQKISEELRHPFYLVSLQLITYFVKEEQ
jgi:TorA maturation chaperone TorD